MKRTQSGTDWLNAVAGRAGVDVSSVEEVLTARCIKQSPVVGSPRRLLLKRIAFAGEKTGVSNSGAFDFSWDDLDHGLWGMVTERNLSGKSSVIEVVRWLLRGRPSDILQEDVRRWITNASLRFKLDEFVYEIRAETTGQLSGTLMRIDADRERKRASFTNEKEFEAVMSDFFMREFNLDSVTNWRDGAGEGEGRPVLHGWPALSGVMFIGTDYSSLLGDMPATTGVGIRLMQMYLGLPWISTLTASQAILKGVETDQAIKERRRAGALELREIRIAEIKAELETKQRELARTPSDAEVRSDLGARSREFADAKKTERELHERFEREDKALIQAEAAYAEDRRDLQAHLDSEAAGAVFRMLDPTCCPRCDADIADERREKEKSSHACSVCGERITAAFDAAPIRSALSNRVHASKALLDKISLDRRAVADSSALISSTVNSLNSEIESLMANLASFGARNHIELDVARLEARLSEATYDPEPDEPQADDSRVLKAVVEETNIRVKAEEVDLLTAISEKLVTYARRFGMDALESAELRGNMTLPLVKGGERTSYSKCTEGEKLRLKVATVLAMISVAESNGVGRHPGLLMIDSPGAQEVSQQDLDALIAGLEEVSKEFRHLQVFVAALASPALRKHIPAKRMRHAEGEDALW
jgi:hypothetical protein